MNRKTEFEAGQAAGPAVLFRQYEFRHNFPPRLHSEFVELWSGRGIKSVCFLLKPLENVLWDGIALIRSSPAGPSAVLLKSAPFERLA